MVDSQNTTTRCTEKKTDLKTVLLRGAIDRDLYSGILRGAINRELTEHRYPNFFFRAGCYAVLSSKKYSTTRYKMRKQNENGTRQNQ